MHEKVGAAAERLLPKDMNGKIKEQIQAAIQPPQSPPVPAKQNRPDPLGVPNLPHPGGGTSNPASKNPRPNHTGQSTPPNQKINSKTPKSSADLRSSLSSPRRLGSSVATSPNNSPQRGIPPQTDSKHPHPPPSSELHRVPQNTLALTAHVFVAVLKAPHQNAVVWHSSQSKAHHN